MLKTVRIALALLVILCVTMPAAHADHSRAWYRRHHRMAEWYRRHRHSAAWYRHHHK